MSNTTILIIAGVVILVIFFLIAKLAIRWAIRLLIVGVILIALLGIGGFWWWSSQLAPQPQPKPRQPSTPTKRASLQ
jgi:energy-coupling factor transporter transmembrane protein EcfT